MNVPDVFCGTAITAVEQIQELDAVKKLDPVAAREKLQYVQAFRPLYDKLLSLGQRLNDAVMSLKAEVAADSLQIYRVAKSFASDKRSPVVQAHVANMKRDLNRPGLTKAQCEERKKKAAEEKAEKEKEVKAA